MKNIIAILLLNFVLFACNNNTSNEQILAKVGKTYLYPSALLGDDYTAAEVEEITEIQIEEWIKKQLWFAEAKKNIDKNIEIENKVKDYEQNLYISAYQDNLVQGQENLVSKEDIVNYYTKHKINYILNENKYKMQYVELSSEISNLDEISKALNDDVQSQFIQDHCSDNKGLCLLEATWVNDAILDEMTLPDYLRKTSAKFESYFKGDKKVALYRILERRMEGEASPLELVSAEIATVINFNKSNEVLKKREDQLFKNAQNNQDFEIYK